MANKRKIVVLDGHTLNPGDNPWTKLEEHGQVVVHDRTPDSRVVERSLGTEVLVVNKVRLTRDILEQLPALKLVAVTATGFDCVDIQAAREQGIAVCNVPVYGTDSVAQFVFAHLLHHCHNVALHDREVRAGVWERAGDFSFWKTPQVELVGMTMGIVGFGRIGRRVGELAHAFGMSVIAHDVVIGPKPTYEPFEWSELEDLVSRADVVSLHCLLTGENAGMINADLLARFKDGAFLINASRGGLVNEKDLAATLKSGKLSGAALDVVSTEPITPDNPLLRADNCTISPHMAWSTLAARRRLLETTVDNIGDFYAGKSTNVVN